MYASTATSPGLTPLTELSEQVASLANGHRTSLAAGPTNWDDFRQSGFGDTIFTPTIPKTVNLKLSPQEVPLPLSPLEEEPRQTEPRASLPLRAVLERIIEIDDAFLPFVELTQLAGVDLAFNRLCLVRISVAVSTALVTNPPVEWLLLTVTVKWPAAPPALLVPRGPSPSGESTLARKRFSLGGLASTFRRSVSGSVRVGSNTGGQSSSSEADQHSTPKSVLPPVSEQPLATPAAAKPSTSTLGIDSLESAAGLHVVARALNGPASTPTTDWHYVAEGGANLVFGYHGTNKLYKGRALRIPKPSEKDEMESTRIWREELLPRLLPKAYLADGEQVVLDSAWISGLLEQSKGARPPVRIESDQGVWPDTVKALLMTDLRTGRRVESQNVLAIEIKVRTAGHIRMTGADRCSQSGGLRLHPNTSFRPKPLSSSRNTPDIAFISIYEAE